MGTEAGELIDDGAVATAATEKTHPLNSRWTLYYHDPEDQRWSIDSYVQIGAFDSVEGFWSLYNQLPPQSFYLGMFFLMRDDIRPTWEDDHNRAGGCWSYKIGITDVFKLWLDLSVYLVAETLTPEPLLMNGISVSPKKGFCILKIWNRDRNKHDTSYITNDLAALDHTQSLYTAFKSK